MLTVFAETGGMTMILPILSFIERNRDVEAFAASSRLARSIASSYQAVGVPVSVLTLSIIALLLIIARQVINYLNTVEMERIKSNIGRRISMRLFEELLQTRASYIRRFKTGEFTQLVDFESQATASIARVYGAIWMQSVAFACYGIVLIWTAPVASACASVVIACTMAVLRVQIRKAKTLSSIGLDIRRTYADFLNERFRAWKLIKLGNTLPAEIDKMGAIQDQVVGNQVKLARASNILALTFMPAIAALLLGTLYIFVEVLSLDIATVALFGLVMLRLGPAARALQKQSTMLIHYSPSCERVAHILDEAREYAEDVDRGRTFTALAQYIRFEQVSFTYPDRDQPALSDITLEIPAGRMTAIVGPSGGGKSTLVDLIPRLINPDRGRILFDGIPSTEISIRALRNAIAYVPQEPFLFDATVANNIRYVRHNATDEEVIEAARLANAQEFIEQLPNGYITALGDAGNKLSGGQKQRIVLARAFLCKPSILILDEPTSALDYDSEAAIQRVLEDMARQHALTIIVIAHRLSTLRNADLVISLAGGMLKGIGSPNESLPKESYLGGHDVETGLASAT